MGYRSTLVSNNYGGDLPNWFKEKYSDRLLYPDGTMIVSKSEYKHYDNDLFNDYQKALIEIDFFPSDDFIIGIAVIGENRIITKVLISKDEIRYILMNEGCDYNEVWY